MKVNDKGNKIYVLDYVNDMLYYVTNKIAIKEFEQQLQKRFNLELMGQAHWYLSTWINQLSNYDIELDQSRYCKAIIRKYLDTARTKRDLSIHPTPLPLDFIATSEDCYADNIAVKHLETEYNVEYASCIGSLIYLGMTRCDTIYAIKKLAKFSKKPGHKHFEALFHLLCYLRDHSNYGMKFYSDFNVSPISKML